MIRHKLPKKPAPTHDYRVALQNAVAWLGSRYLLAEPLNRRPETPERRPNEPQAA